MKKQTGSFATRLVGATVKPTDDLIERQGKLMELLEVSRLWGLKPNEYGKYTATVEAAFLNDENSIVVLLRGPLGDTKRTFFFDGLWEIEEVGKQ